jgi:hypothetical protein
MPSVRGQPERDKIPDKSMWAGPTRKIGKSMWAGPTREKKKRTYYILCQSYPQALKGHIN